MAGGTGASGNAAPQIRYALSQLRSKNRHHEFEHLCRELARLRITPNILPATGPVSAGGDQGRDFETFRTCMQQRLPGTFLAAEGDLRIVFACTLQRENLSAKIRNDLQAIMGIGPVDRVYFFCEQDIPVARRHELCQWARADHGTDIEIIDGQALSELLAAEDCLHIAERYLGVEVPGRQPRILPLGDCPPGPFSGITETGIQAEVIHGDVNIYHGNVNIYHGKASARVPSTVGHWRRRTLVLPGRPHKRWRRTIACLIAVAAAVAPVLIVAPWGHSPFPRSPATVLDDVAARKWNGPVSFDSTFLSGRTLSVPLTLSFDPSPSEKPGARVGSISYGQGCPHETVTLIRNHPRTLTLADTPPTGSVPPSCHGNSAAALFLSGLKPAISITLAGVGPQAGISVLAAAGRYGTIYRGALHSPRTDRRGPVCPQPVTAGTIIGPLPPRYQQTSFRSLTQSRDRTT